MGNHQLGADGLFITSAVIRAAQDSQRALLESQDPVGYWWHTHGVAGHSHRWSETHFHPDAQGSTLVAERDRARFSQGKTSTALGRTVVMECSLLAGWDRPPANHELPPDTAPVALTYPEVCSDWVSAAAGYLWWELEWRATLLRNGTYPEKSRDEAVRWVQQGVAHWLRWSVTQRYWYGKVLNGQRWVEAFRTYMGQHDNHQGLVEASEVMLQDRLYAGTIHDLFGHLGAELSDDDLVQEVARRLAMTGRERHDEDHVASLGLTELVPVYGADGWLGEVPPVFEPS